MTRAPQSSSFQISGGGTLSVTDEQTDGRMEKQRKSSNLILNNVETLKRRDFMFILFTVLGYLCEDINETTLIKLTM